MSVAHAPYDHGVQSPMPYTTQTGPMAHAPALRPALPRWAIIAVAVSIAISAVAVAVAVMAFSGRHGKDTTAAGPTPAIASAQATATCAAWRATAPALNAIPALPAGWTPSTPGINEIIAADGAAVATALDLFEPRISDRDGEVASQAREFVAAKRGEWQKLADYTYAKADGVAGNIAMGRLNELCAANK